jgi:hypothetical protein
VYCSTATESECVAGGRTSAPSFKMSVASTRGERTGHYLMQAIVVGREGGHRRHTRIEAPEEAGDIVDTGCVEQQRGLRSPPGCLENAGRDRTGAPVQFRIADLLSACVVERGPKGVRSGTWAALSCNPCAKLAARRHDGCAVSNPSAPGSARMALLSAVSSNDGRTLGRSVIPDVTLRANTFDFGNQRDRPERG